MEITKVKKDDKFVFYVDVGNLPPSKIVDYLGSIKKQFNNTFDNDTIFIPERKFDGGCKIEILRKEE